MSFFLFYSTILYFKQMYLLFHTIFNYFVFVLVKWEDFTLLVF